MQGIKKSVLRLYFFVILSLRKTVFRFYAPGKPKRLPEMIPALAEAERNIRSVVEQSNIC
jgi:hypothetical protein